MAVSTDRYGGRFAELDSMALWLSIHCSSEMLILARPSQHQPAQLLRPLKLRDRCWIDV